MTRPSTPRPKSTPQVAASANFTSKRAAARAYIWALLRALLRTRERSCKVSNTPECSRSFLDSLSLSRCQPQICQEVIDYELRTDALTLLEHCPGGRERQLHVQAPGRSGAPLSLSLSFSLTHKTQTHIHTPCAPPLHLTSKRAAAQVPFLPTERERESEGEK